VASGSDVLEMLKSYCVNKMQSGTLFVRMQEHEKIIERYTGKEADLIISFIGFTWTKIYS
jgi:hypothetical protein